MSNYAEAILELFDLKSFPYSPESSVYDLLGNKNIVLYGCGNLGLSFCFRFVKKYGLKLSACLDRKFKTGASFYGVPAFSPFEYRPTDDEKENTIAIVTVEMREYHEEIFNCLRGLGFKNIISALDIYESHLCNIPEELEKNGFDYYLENKKRIMESFELFSDDLSLDIFVRVIQTHMLRKSLHFPNHALEEQYFPKDIRMNKGYSRCVNCGAYDGDTVRRLNLQHGKVDALACFEPDPDNYGSLVQYLGTNHEKIAQSIIAFPCGVFSRDSQLRFAGGNTVSSAISEEGESVIQCVALDHAIPGFKPTFINMDVEGVELEALKGAEMLIKENKPDLAISVYHGPHDIWDIPLYIDNLQLGYEFHLRNYTSFVGDTVLYATTSR